MSALDYYLLCFPHEHWHSAFAHPVSTESDEVGVATLSRCSGVRGMEEVVQQSGSSEREIVLKEVKCCGDCLDCLCLIGLLSSTCKMNVILT